jgi:membrane-bound lytic murein transglycosylase
MALKWDLLKINKQELPQITPLQMAENGGIDIEKSLALAMAQPKSLKEKLGGRTVSIDTETLNPETNEMEINRVAKYQPGLLEDIRSGAKENFATGFAAPNLEQNITPDGRKKGLGYRFGEGLGSFARFANSPLGRGLLMAGIVGATGGTALPAMAFGAQAGFGNKQVRLKDQLYRNALAEREIDTSDIGGFIDDNTFKYLLEDQQLRDNAAYRKMYYDIQDQNQKDLMEYRKMQLNRDTRQDAFNNYIKSEELKLAKDKINQDKKTNNINNLQAVSQQLKRFEESFKNMPKKLESNTLGRLRAATGFQTENEANFNSQRQLLFNKIARDLGGEKGVLSDQDIKRIEGALPSYTDSMAQKQAKMQAIYDLLNDRLAVEGGSLNETTTNEGWAF